jgi:hypothetical protein
MPPLAQYLSASKELRHLWWLKTFLAQHGIRAASSPETYRTQINSALQSVKNLAVRILSEEKTRPL